MKRLNRTAAEVLVFAISSAVCVTSSAATNVVINASSTGSLYTCSSCNHTVQGFLVVAGYIQGIVRFPTALIGGSVTNAMLTLNPYGLPLFDSTVDVYGITTGDGHATYGDAFSGDFLGTFVLPPNLGYGQDASFDVTPFIASAHVPYVGFNLRTDTGTDDFSSLGENYGHGPQLHVTFVPEPTTATLLLLGMLGRGWRRRR